MIDGIFASEIYQVLEKSLNAASMQHQMISNNISNVDTPGFKRSEVVFQSKLNEVLGFKEVAYLPLTVTNKNHIPIVPNLTVSDINPEIVVNNETSLRTDDNNVDIDSEMSKLAENTAYYSSLAQLTSLKLGMLQSVISDGRK
jgi:flagellar basal-body rod protein FlgB